VPYANGSFTGEASKNGVKVHVERNAEGRVAASYTTSGERAARGHATVDSKGKGEASIVFGGEATGGREAMYAADRLARALGNGP
jgi:hypothetical protein